MTPLRVKDLKPGMFVPSLSLVIEEVFPPVFFNRFGKQRFYTRILLTDGSKSVYFTVWNEDVSHLRPGDRLLLSNVKVRLFRGEIVLSGSWVKSK